MYHKFLFGLRAQKQLMLQIFRAQDTHMLLVIRTQHTAQFEIPSIFFLAFLRYTEHTHPFVYLFLALYTLFITKLRNKNISCHCTFKCVATD